MKSQRVAFKNQDGITLSANLDMPSDRVRGTALFAHCFSCSKDLRSMKRVAAALVDCGLAVLRFDFTGLGSSEGEFSDTNFSSNVGDLLAGADWLRQHHSAPTLLVGHSLGGAAAIAAAPGIEELKALAVIGAPSDPAHVAHLFEGSTPEIEARGEAAVTIGGRPFTIKKQFLEDVKSASLGPALESDVSLLVLHSPTDDVVGVENGYEIFDMAAEPKSFVSLEGGDHLLSDPKMADYAGAVLAAWANRIVDQVPRPSEDVVHAASEGEVVVAERGTGKFAQRIHVGGRHVLWADEPIGIGDDTGAGPYDLLLASLGACTSMTVRMYADRKGWPLESVAVSLHHDKVHAQDCSECETKTGQIDSIRRELHLHGPLDDEQLQRLLAIADRCPVHRTLHGEIHIETEIAAGH